MLFLNTFEVNFMGKVLTVVLMVLVAGASFAQKVTPYSLYNYSPVNGLPQSQVHAIIEDANGYLWIGTEGGGLARFDGREFKVYTTLDGLLTNLINGLYIDNKSNLWVLHPQGLSKFDGMKFTRYQTPGAPQNFQNGLRSIGMLNDTLFVLSMTGRWTKIYNDSIYYWSKVDEQVPDVYWLHQAPHGQLISVTPEGTICVRDQQEKYCLQFTPKKQGFRFNIFNHGDEVWFKSGYETYRINFSERKIEETHTEIGRYVLYYDEAENVYWTRNRNTLFREQSDGSRIIKTDTVLKNTDAWTVLPDAEGNMWIATNGRGVFKYFGQDFTNVGSDNLRVAMAILVDSEKNMWVGSLSTGLWRIKDGKLKSYSDHSIVSVREAPDKTIWAGSSGGLGKYDREKDKFTWFTVKHGLSSMTVMNITPDNKGGLWIGTHDGLNYFDGRIFRNYFTQDGLSSNTIWSTHFSSYYGALFVGTEMGINKIKDGKIDRLNVPGIYNTSVCTINAYRDSLLVAGVGGLGVMIIDPRKGKLKTITTRDGLASDFIYFAAPDDEGVLWIGSEKGITRVRLNEHLEVMENLHYDNVNGLIGMETNQNAFYFDGKEKYFGLIDGLYKYNHIDRRNKRSFDLHLTDVDLFYGVDSPVNYSDSLMGLFKIPYRPLLPPDKNHITFHFNRVDKLFPKSVKFRYYLENFDKTWSQPSSMNQATYSNLPPGDYVFRVMATDNKGSWDTEQIAYAFTILTPFYKRASFIAAMVILLAGSITLIAYLRIRQRVRLVIETERIRIREQENVRKEIARDFHDEMGNQLTRIINYISLMKLNGKNGNGHPDLYSKVEESAKYLYTGTRDFIWSIDPGNDELTRLFLHIRDFGEKLFEEKGICFRAFDEVKEKVKLPPGFSREANLIFKEAMTNSFKYSDAKNVTLTLRHNDESFEMSLEDDGVGFVIPETTKSNGIKNISERADKIGSVLRITSIKDKGTKISLNFNLKRTSVYGTTV